MTHEALQKEYISLKRQLFDLYYSDLNDIQRQAVFTVNGPLLILAGAGSGKTTVLVNRIVHTIRYGNAYESEFVPQSVSEAEINAMHAARELSRDELGEFLQRFRVDPPPAWSVLAITFTNKAAGEIKKRVAAVFGEDSREVADIWCGTFHSICMRLLRRKGAEYGFGRDIGIADSDDSKKLISAAMKQLNIDEKKLSVRDVMNTISRAKDHLKTPEDFSAEAGIDFKQKQIAQIYTLYQNKLRDSNLLDFDDIIMQTVLLIQNNPQLKDELQRRFRYISVDEYQDTNRAQLELSLLLAGKHRNLMVVGDDDQSIYKFRGADIDNILTFDRQLEDVRTIRLEQNYRSTKKILSAANELIRNNSGRLGKELWCDGNDGDAITVIACRDQNDEAYAVADEIQSLVRSGHAYRDIAVLYRMNAQSRMFEQSFTKNSIPYRMLGGLRFYDRAEIKDMLAYLCVINNPLDSVHLTRIINTPRRGIGAKAIENANIISVAEGYSLLEFLHAAPRYKAISAAAAKSMEALYELISEFRSAAATLPLHELFELVFRKSGYFDMLREMGEAEAERIDNVNELITSAELYEHTVEDATLTGFLEDVALISDVDKYDEAADAVVLMTVHSAKGLEFPCVFTVGMEEGVFPSSRSIYSEADLEEERRLAYVAYTRAKERLFITYARERMLMGTTQQNRPSRFAEEIPDALTERIDRTESYGRPKKYIFDDEIQKNPRADIRPRATPKPQKPKEKLSAGERISHRIFGSGTIISSRDMGADVLYEVAFDNVGTKKLMGSVARLTKLSEQ